MFLLVTGPCCWFSSSEFESSFEDDGLVIGGVFGRRLENPLFLFLATGGASFSDPELLQILKVTCLVNLLGLIGFGGGCLEIDGSDRISFFVNCLIGGCLEVDGSKGVDFFLIV